MTPTNKAVREALKRECLDILDEDEEDTDDIVSKVIDHLALRLARMEWRDIASAPREQTVLVYGTGGVALGIKDQLGNWRKRHGGPHRTLPTHWMPLPKPPEVKK